MRRAVDRRSTSVSSRTASPQSAVERALTPSPSIPPTPPRSPLPHLTRAKAASKKGGSAALFGFGKKKEAEAPPAKKGFGFGGKAKAAAAPAKKPTRFGANLPGRRKEPLEEKKKAFSLFGK